MLELSAAEAIVDVKDAAEYAGLTYVSDERAGILRKRSGKGFRYESGQGSKVTHPRALKRIKGLAVPPAWTEVWVCPTASGHIQGRDARGQAVPLSRSLSRGAREHEIPSHARFCREPACHSPARTGTPGIARAIT